MADIDTTLLTDLLIEDVEPAVNDQLKYETVAYAMLRKNAGVEALDNLKYSLPLRSGRTSGTYGVTESNNSVIYGSPSYDKAILDAKTITTAFKMTHQALAVKDKGSAVPLFDQITKDVSDDYMHAVNRMTFGDGTGKIGTAAGTGTSSTAFTFAASQNGDLDYAEYVPVGSYIKIGSNSAVQVTAITGKNAVTLGSALSWSAADAVKLTNSSGTVSTEINGFGSIIGTGSLQNIDGSTNTFWQAYLKDNSAASLSSESTLNSVFISRQKQGSTEFLITNASLFNSYASLLTTQKRAVNQADVMGGWAGIEFMGGKCQILLDFDCNDERFIGVDTDAMTIAELEPFHFLQDSGASVALHRIDGTLDYEVVGVHIFDIATKKRNALWTLYNVAK